MKNRKYNVGDTVYHVTPESDKGIVINAYYNLLFNLWTYQVTFSPHTESLDYYEHELQETKTF